MNIFTTLKLAMRALWRNKVRSSLTMLGIVFGIGAVIAMVAVGQGAQQSVKDVFQNLGTNVLILTNGSQRSFGAAGGAGSRQSLTWDDMAALQTGEIANIKWVAPMLQGRVQVASEDANWNTSVIGTTSVWFQIRSWAASQGTVFDEDAGNSNAKITVIGQTVATQLYGTANPVGQTIRIGGQPYEIVGVLAAKGQGPFGDTDDTLVIPVKTYQQKIEKGLAKYIKGQVLISMTVDELAERTMAGITTLMRDRHKLDGSDEDDFRIRNPAEFAQAQQDSTQRITTLLAIVAAVSLLVGGIGVMNIMLVSVTERIREIGLRKALGATPHAVRRQFLVEASALGLCGGLLGIALGLVGAQVLPHFLDQPVTIPPLVGVGALGIALVIGIVAGVYPASRAARLAPIDALRSE